MIEKKMRERIDDQIRRRFIAEISELHRQLGKGCVNKFTLFLYLFIKVPDWVGMMRFDMNERRISNRPHSTSTASPFIAIKTRSGSSDSR